MNQKREDEILNTIAGFKPGNKIVNVFFFAPFLKTSNLHNFTYIGYKEIYEKVIKKHHSRVESSYEIAFWSGRGGIGLISTHLKKENFDPDYLCFKVDVTELNAITEKACKVIANRQ